MLIAQSAGAIKYTDCKTPPNEHVFIASAPLWPGMVAPIYGLDRTNCILTPNWIVWNGNVLTLKHYLH